MTVGAHPRTSSSGAVGPTTTADASLFGVAEHDVSPQSLRGLDWFNFFLAAMLTGFGPFVALYLSGQGWTAEQVGFVLTASGLAGLLFQVPGGELLDAVPSKRAVVAVALATIAGAATILSVLPSFVPVLIAQLLLGVTGGFLGPAVAAISLGLVGSDRLPERLGRNQRLAAIGGFAAAGLMGLIGSVFSNRAIFFATAALVVPTLVALDRIRGRDIHFARACGAAPGDYHPARPPRHARATVGRNNRLLAFASCIALFQIANASILPLVSEELGAKAGSSLVISALIFVPQIVVAAIAPWVGHRAMTWGRRPLMLIGLAALPIRAAGFAQVEDPALLVALQLLDGISGAVVGVLTPLVIADITRGTGRFNLAQGIVGTFSGVGAALSTTVMGYVAQSLGLAAGFYAIVAAGSAALAVCWAFVPETNQTRAASAIATQTQDRP